MLSDIQSVVFGTMCNVVVIYPCAGRNTTNGIREDDAQNDCRFACTSIRATLGEPRAVGSRYWVCVFLTLQRTKNFHFRPIDSADLAEGETKSQNRTIYLIYLANTHVINENIDMI